MLVNTAQRQGMECVRWVDTHDVWTDRSGRIGPRYCCRGQVEPATDPPMAVAPIPSTTDTTSALQPSSSAFCVVIGIDKETP